MGSRSRSGSRDAKKLSALGNARTFMIGKKKKAKKGSVRNLKIKKKKVEESEKSKACSIF